MPIETVFIVFAVVVVLVVGFAAYMNNFEKKQYTAEIQALRADVAKIPLVGAPLSQVGQPQPVTVTVNHAPTTATVTPPATTTTVFGGSQPAGTVSSPNALETFNGVPVPAGMTLASFTALGVATQGVQAMVSNPDLHASLVGATLAWFHSLGDYFREELLAQATGDTLVAMQTLAAGYTPLPITAAQQAAADAAVKAVAPMKA